MTGWRFLSPWPSSLSLSISCNKALGLDWLTTELYRACWDVLGPDLAAVWAEAEACRELPPSCRRAVSTLLLKKGELRNLRKWRPVSLLCTD